MPVLGRRNHILAGVPPLKELEEANAKWSGDPCRDEGKVEPLATLVRETPLMPGSSLLLRGRNDKERRRRIGWKSICRMVSWIPW